MEQLRAMFHWLAGGGTQYQMAECKWQGMGVQCAVSFVDGCIKAFGAPEGLPGKMTFRSREDGTLQQVIGFLEPAERKAYNDWLEGMDAWASANRAQELAQAEGYSKRPVKWLSSCARTTRPQASQYCRHQHHRQEVRGLD